MVGRTCRHCGAASDIAYGYVGTLCPPCWERRRGAAYAAVLFLPALLPLLAGGSPRWWWLGLHPLLYLAVGAHEAAHALAGRLVGFRVFEAQLGTGPRMAAFRVAGTRVELRAVPLCGFTAWAPTRPRGYSWRLFAAVAAGPSVSAVALLAAALLWPAAPRLALGLAATNGWLLLGSLVPRAGNDGAALIRRRRTRDEAAAALALGPYWESVVRWKAGDHEGARRAADEALAGHPGWVSAEDVLAGALTGLGRHRQARQVLLRILASPHAPPGLWATSLLSLAWADLCSGDPELLFEADAASRAALRLLPWKAFARAVRALALVEQGDPAAGLALAPSLWSGGLDRRERAAAAAVRALGLARLGHPEPAHRHLAWVAVLDPACPLLDRAQTALHPTGGALRGVLAAVA